MATLHHLFEQAREEAGGAAEGELQNRYPDRRLWNAYNQRWKRELRKHVRLADTSLLGTALLAPGHYQIPLHGSDVHVSLVTVPPADPNDRAQHLIPTTRESLLRDGYDLTQSGEPTHCYLDCSGSSSFLAVWPVPETSLTLTLFGDGTPADELTDADFDADAPAGNLKNLTAPNPIPPGWYNPYTVEAMMPDGVYLSCIYYLAWFIAHTDERSRGTAIENSQWALYQSQLHDDVAWYNLTLPVSI